MNTNINFSTIESAFNSATQSENFRPEQSDGQLVAIPASVRSPEFYGLSNLTPFSSVGVLARLKERESEGQKFFTPEPLDAEEAQLCKGIVGLSPAEMDRILKEKTAAVSMAA